MTRTTLGLAGLVAAFLICSPRAASAQQLEMFTDRAAFEAAAKNSLTVRDFQELPDDLQVPDLHYPGVRFHSTDGDPADLYVLSPELYPGLPALQSRVLMSNRNFNPLSFDFFEQTTAVGADVLALTDGTGVDVIVTGPDGSQTFNVPFASGGPKFVGFIARTGQIHSVSVANVAGQQQYVCVDNVAHGVAAVEPQQPPVDPMTAALNRLDAAIADGVAKGTIRMNDRTLQSLASGLREAIATGNRRRALCKIELLWHTVRFRTPKKITAEKGAELHSILAEIRSLL